MPKLYPAGAVMDPYPRENAVISQSKTQCDNVTNCPAPEPVDRVRGIS